MALPHTLHDYSLLYGRSAGVLITNEIKNALPGADFDSIELMHNFPRLTYIVGFIRNGKSIGTIEVDNWDELVSDVCLAKIMLLCG